MVPVPRRLPAFCTSVEIHGHVEVLFDEKIGGSPARQQSAKLQAVAHSSGMLFQNFAHGGAHGQFPEAGPLHFSAGAIQLRAAISACGSSRWNQLAPFQ